MKLNLEKSLYKAGLDDKEAEIYSYLLKHSGGTPTEIADMTNISRSTVYKVLVRLSIKGIVGESKKGKKRYYFAEKPTKLKRYKSGQIRNIERQMSYVDDLMPKLEDLYTTSRNTIQSHYYEGEDIKKIYDDHISYDNYEMLAIANIHAVDAFWQNYSYWKSYIQGKIKHKITTRALVPDTQSSQGVIEGVYGDVPKWVQPEVKKLPISFFSFQGEYMIYGKDRVSMINLKEGSVSGVIIVDKTFNKMMRNFFELVWLSQK
ncbi:BlaI/MecI/CopY family transcriptional regulator [Patescibacteria group bacterium]|nr:BlaI/MecI/CopY family transcriptional regulator [Patescibacteria group bacterium]